MGKSLSENIFFLQAMVTQIFVLSRMSYITKTAATEQKGEHYLALTLIFIYLFIY